MDAGGVSWKIVLFRRMMRAIRKLPNDRLIQARVTCRAEFRLGGSLSREDAEKKAEKSLRYVQMLTPAKRSSGNAGRYVIRDGELVQETGKSVMRGGVLVRNETGITPEHYERHVKLLRRQHFMDRKG